MEARPHPIIEGIVARLLPLACREHVLGDLHERYVSTGRYVWDATRTLPYAVWGQIRRTTSPLLAVAELGAVYVAFLGALGSVNLGALGTALAPIGAAIAAITALVTVALRDAWVGRTWRPNPYLVLDAILGVALAGASHALLHAIGSRFALEPAALLAGCAISLPLLAGVRISLHSFFQATVTGNAEGSKMNSTESQTPGGQRDLRVWWWTIAVVGLTACVGLLAHPATVRIRPFILGWFAAFLIIGLHQRRKTRWPERPPESATTNELHSYRLVLERRRDEQLRWPARRLRIVVGTVTIAVLISLVRLFASSGSTNPLMDAFAGPLLVAGIAFAMYVFTRKLTNRAAAAFQRELDDVSQRESSQRE
jgi:hypothetical protein